MAKSLFNHGLTYIASSLLNALFQDDIGIFSFLSCTYPLDIKKVYQG